MAGIAPGPVVELACGRRLEADPVLVDGVYVEPSARDSRALAEGAVLAIWPLVAGG